MKNIYFKTASVVLAVSILQLAGGFCYASVSKPVIRVVPTNVCGDKTMPMPSPIATPMASGNPQGLLPCCAQGGHPSVITFSQSFELGKLILTPAHVFENFLPIILEPEVYRVPKVPPPKLLAVKKTVLRL